MSHWYDDKGKQHYGAGIKEAREKGYFGSVTSIIGETIRNQGIEQYKQNQIFEAVIEAQAENFLYTDAELKKRAFEISKRHARKAAQLGKVVHYMIADYLRGKPVHRLQSNKPHWVFAPVRDWIDENIWGGITEYVLVNTQLGYAGKADFICTLKDGRDAIIDWKTSSVPTTQMTKSGQPYKSRWYDTWCMQLAALNESLKTKRVVLSVMIGTDPTNYGCWVKEWTEEEQAKAWECFKAALTIWRIKNKMPQRVLM